MAIAALTLGLTGLFTWLFPLFGFPVSGVGLILAAISRAMGKDRKGMARTALILGAVGIILNVVSTIYGLIAFENYIEWMQ